LFRWFNVFFFVSNGAATVSDNGVGSWSILQDIPSRHYLYWPVLRSKHLSKRLGNSTTTHYLGLVVEATVSYCYSGCSRCDTTQVSVRAKLAAERILCTDHGCWCWTMVYTRTTNDDNRRIILTAIVRRRSVDSSGALLSERSSGEETVTTH
jgi:hypothetical protein